MEPKRVAAKEVLGICGIPQINCFEGCLAAGTKNAHLGLKIHRGKSCEPWRVLIDRKWFEHFFYTELKQSQTILLLFTNIYNAQCHSKVNQIHETCCVDGHIERYVQKKGVCRKENELWGQRTFWYGTMHPGGRQFISDRHFKPKLSSKDVPNSFNVFLDTLSLRQTELRVELRVTNDNSSTSSRIIHFVIDDQVRMSFR